MSRPLHVIAVGARTPVGLTAETSAAAIRAGISRQSGHPFIVDHAGEELLCARDRGLDPDLLGVPRMTALATAVLNEVTAKLDQAGVRLTTVPVLLALPETRPGFSDADRMKVVAEVAKGSGGTRFRIESVGRGHAGGLQAMAEASRRLEQSREELCVVAGVDTYLNADTLDWLQANRQLAITGVRSGFLPGEGAGAVVLVSERSQRAFAMPGLATVRGLGVAQETKLIKTDAINLGEGLSAAISAASVDLRVPEERIDATYCDINGERHRTEEWGFALLRTQTWVHDSAYNAPADCWGDVGAASVPLVCNLAIQSWARRYAAGPRALIWASSEGGLRGAAVLQSPQA